MKTTNSLIRIFSVAAAVMLAVVCVVCVFNIQSENTALAAGNNFEIVLPNGNYMQIETPQYVGVSNAYLTVYDSANYNLCAIGRANGKQVRVDLAQYAAVHSIWQVGNSAFVEYLPDGANAYQYARFDLSAETPVATAVSLSTPNKINLIFSDGNHLYAKAFDGTIACYDASANLLFATQVDCLGGNIAVGANGNKAASFYQNSSLQLEMYVVSLDINNDANDDNVIDGVYPLDAFRATTAYVAGGCVFAFSSDQNLLKVFDGANGATLFASTVDLSRGFTVFDSAIYAIGENGITEYKINAAKTDLDKTNEYAMSGNYGSLLDKPSCIECDDNGFTYVADKANNQLLVLDDNMHVESRIAFDSPVSVAASGNGVYVASTTSVAFVQNGEIKQTYAINSGFRIKSIAWFDKLYVLASSYSQNKIFTLFAGEFTPFADANNAVDIASSKDGAFLYVLASSASENGVYALDTYGMRAPLSLSLAGNGYIALKVDYAGNLYVLDGANDIIRYLRSADGYTADGSIVLSSDSYDCTATDFALKSYDKAVFVTEENFVAQTAFAHVDTVALDTLPSASNATSISIYTTASTAYMFENSARLEKSTIIPSEAKIAVFEGVSTRVGFKFALYNGKFGFFDQNAITVASPTVPKTTAYVTVKDDATLYKYPLESSGAILCNLPQNFALTAIDDVALFDDGKWLRVEHNGASAYVLQSDVKVYGSSEPVDKAQNGKAQANRIGGTVAMYLLPDDESEIIFKIGDGAKLEVFNQIDGFYYVKYGDMSGYVKIDDVKIGGLTAAQIVGIVLAIATLLAGIAVLVVTNYTRKKQAAK